VDLRRDSATFGKWTGVTLSGENRRQLWVPEGFGHGFLVTGPHAEVLYKTTEYWYPDHERTLAWNDPALGIVWPIEGLPQLAPKDATGRRLTDAELF
jgi:dTDP-4-dehydrorhamnose 3,5-epimerase